MAVSSLEALEPVGFGAMTLGLAVVGIDQATLCALRAHEHAHARQFEEVGTVFLPACALSSLWQVVNGHSAHGSNFFERQACAVASRAPSENKLLTELT